MITISRDEMIRWMHKRITHLTAEVERLREWQGLAVLVLEHWMLTAEFDLDELEVLMEEADDPRDYADDVYVHSESRELIAGAKKSRAALEVDE